MDFRKWMASRGTKKVTLHIDGRTFAKALAKQNCHTLLALAGRPAEYQVFLEGKTDKQIGGGDWVTLADGDRLYTLPPTMWG